MKATGKSICEWICVHAPRGYGRLRFILDTVEQLYSEAYLMKPNTYDMFLKREGKIEAYREVLKLLRTVINE